MKLVVMMMICREKNLTDGRCLSPMLTDTRCIESRRRILFSYFVLRFFKYFKHARNMNKRTKEPGLDFRQTISTNIVDGIGRPTLVHMHNVFCKWWRDLKFQCITRHGAFMSKFVEKKYMVYFSTCCIVWLHYVMFSLWLLCKKRRRMRISQWERKEQSQCSLVSKRLLLWCDVNYDYFCV